MASALEKVLTERKVYAVPLSPGSERRGEMSARWKIIQNMEAESELNS
jgi:predicted transcriptional regulator of viral defense system